MKRKTHFKKGVVQPEPTAMTALKLTRVYRTPGPTDDKTT